MADLLITHFVTILISESLPDSKWDRSEPAALQLYGVLPGVTKITLVFLFTTISAFLPDILWLVTHFVRLTFSKEGSRTLLAGSQEVGVILPQRSVQSWSQRDGKGPLSKETRPCISPRSHDNQESSRTGRE